MKPPSMRNMNDNIEHIDESYNKIYKRNGDIYIHIEYTITSIKTWTLFLEHTYTYFKHIYLHAHDHIT